MTLPASIRVNIGAPFPSLVKGSGLVAISKANGIWTVALNFAAVQKSPVVPDPANTYVLVWNALTGVYTLVPMSNVSQQKITRILTGVAPFNSPYAAQPSDDVLIVKQGAANPFAITVDWSQRTTPLKIVSGDTVANFANITITPKAGQTQLTVVNGPVLIVNAGGSVVLTPLPDGSGAY